MYANRDGSVTAPSLPAGYTNISIGSIGTGTSAMSSRTAYTIALGTEANIGAWTNATSIAAIVLTGSWASGCIGRVARGGATNATMSYGGMLGALQSAPSTSAWIVMFGSSRTATNVSSSTPTGSINYSDPDGVLTGSADTIIAAYINTGSFASTQSVRVNAATAWNTCCVEIRAIGEPIIWSGEPTNLGYASASYSAFIQDDGGQQDLAPATRGLCWNTGSTPTTLNSHSETAKNSGIEGYYQDTISGLSSNTSYFVRPYLTNYSGTFYGKETTFTTKYKFSDIDWAILSGSDSSQSEASGWDAIVRLNVPEANITRTSDTVVTINLPAYPTYTISAKESIAWVIPSGSIVAGYNVTGSNAFTINLVDFVASTIKSYNYIPYANIKSFNNIGFSLIKSWDGIQ